MNPQILPLLPFETRIEQEFCQGSAISPALFRASVEIVNDTEVLPGGDVRYPIHEALNWHITRFGRQARANLQAAILLNEDGSPWQVKLSHPRIDRQKGEPNKYEAPAGNGSRAFLPAIDEETRQDIASRYGCEVPPSNQSFWAWLEEHPEISIIWTEGGKKALCLLSLGYVAIALYGVYGGYRADGSLIPDVARFAQPGRRQVLAFDQDAKEKTRRKVERALMKFGRLLEASGGQVAIASWDGQEGKGVDDLVVNAGAAAWEASHSNALPLQHWQIWQRLNHRLTWNPSIKVSTHDLSTLTPDRLPASGIVAVSSGKGTGKTKLAARLVEGQEKALSLNHRIALSRNICERLKLDYRGDLDKTADGRFITGSAYTLRVGTCVDALLAINPQHFAGCDLVIDEAVQVIRHLLTSSTCAQDGKRPALLSRFHELIRTARRVILADADLDNGTLHYFKELRGDDAPVFLVRNDHQSKPYPVRFVRANDFETVVTDLIDDLHQLEQGKTLFVATDNKRVTKAIARLVSNSFQEKRVLVINAETSGGEAEREFIQSPDAVLQRGDYDLIVASPSLATGVSIECQGIIKRVYGIFTGVSSTDADIAQSLARVREPVERVVWVANRGRNYSKVGRSTNPLALKTALMQQTSVNVSLIRSSLKEDTIAAVEQFDWQSDPHLNLYCKLAAEQNFSMLHLRDAVLVRLKHEGHQVTIEDREYDPVARFLYRQAATEQKRIDAEAITNAKVLTYLEAKLLEQQESRSPEDEKVLHRFYLCEFYSIDPDSLTPEFVLWDAEGRRRGELLNLEGLLYPESAIDSTAKALEKQAGWNQGVCPWDISGAALRRELRQRLGLDKFLDTEREWTAEDVGEVAAIARQHSQLVQTVLHFTPSEKLSDVQIVHQLLSQLGVKVDYRWKGTGSGKHRVYFLNAQVWQNLTDILERRQQRRIEIEQRQTEKGSPLPLVSRNLTGDPTPTTTESLEKWLSSESLNDVRQRWREADTVEAREALRKMVPPEVLEKAIA